MRDPTTIQRSLALLVLCVAPAGRACGRDCTIAADGPPEFSSWMHWHPSSRLRLTRTAAAA